VTAGNDTLHREVSARNVDLLIARRFGPMADQILSVEILYDDSCVVAVMDGSIVPSQSDLT
jgi:hypothetical protein